MALNYLKKEDEEEFVPEKYELYIYSLNDCDIVNRLDHYDKDNKG